MVLPSNNFKSPTFGTFSENQSSTGNFVQTRDIGLQDMDITNGKLYYWMDPKEIEKLTSDIQQDMIDNTKIQLVIDDKNFTGGLSKSVEAGGDETFKTVEVNSPYGVFVEFGIGPGTHVPFPKILAWVIGKLGINDEAMARNVAYKVRSKIFNKGIKPSRFFKKAILRFGRKNNLRAKRAESIRKKPAKSNSISKKLNKSRKQAYKMVKKYSKNKMNKFVRKGKSEFKKWGVNT